MILRRGSHGALVEQLQTSLQQHGFNPGAKDGQFGPATEAAVMAFQKANDLLADGIVGPVTSAALGIDITAAPNLTLDAVTIDLVARMFPHTPLRPIQDNLAPIKTAMIDAGLTDKPLVLTALATIRAESEGFVPIDEAPSRYNSSPAGHAFDLYDHRADLGNLGPPDGARYRGRGFVQLTGRDNYRRFGHAIGLQAKLVDRPERANEPAVAARLLAAFVLSRASAIKQAVFDHDLARVRRLVNGGHHGLDRFIEAYRIGDRLLDDPIWQPLAA